MLQLPLHMEALRIHEPSLGSALEVLVEHREPFKQIILNWEPWNCWNAMNLSRSTLSKHGSSEDR